MNKPIVHTSLFYQLPFVGRQCAKSINQFDQVLNQCIANLKTQSYYVFNCYSLLKLQT
ncbi:uncharacterized protein MELLADRAFT_96093 [Melampsora larici-populina 98AG31]|uniref:Uncharacterized protein n=1 Tax=Melampsora larici-populina (strain 98AG31 / pathotype 3-4-7) TaxID=747676 RepID=F4SAX9_MELLP|nr:uncharacterized protein MELLADRAFT_96093 [Melampsora larici-populina 98AG31]EGF98207.1 hypothetical protein MELLADRAFT_96093 [Melampsora larici-populina 98AG31]